MSYGVSSFNFSSLLPSHVAILCRTKIVMKREPNECEGTCWLVRVQCTLASFSLPEGSRSGRSGEPMVLQGGLCQGTFWNILWNIYRGHLAGVLG